MKKYGWLLLALLAAWPVNTLAYGMGDGGVNMLCALVMLVWLAFALWKRKKIDPALLIASAGFVLGLVFVLKLPHSFSYHDLAGYNPDFTGEAKPDGHLGFIAYLVEFGKLPNDNPLIDGYTVFYNPPLHHIVHALFMKLNLALGVQLEAAIENLQLITLGCAAACTLVTIDLLRFLGAGKRGMLTGALLMAFQPCMLIFGATVNNDIQMNLLVILAMLFTVRWHRTRHMRDILLCGVSLGLAMATKLSSALIIPCIAVVFAVAFFRDLKQWKRYVGQFAAFLAVSVPEAVAWPVYHLIAFNAPLNHVRLPAETINVSAYSLWQRYGIPDGKAIRGLFYSGIRKIDHNVWMQTLKSGMFDELALFNEGTLMWYVSYMALVGFAALLLASLALFIRWLIKGKTDGMTKLFLSLFGGILIANYLQFTLQYPYICTFSFRYIMAVLPLCAIAFSHFADTAKHGKWLPTVYCLLFAAAVVFIYAMYFFGPSQFETIRAAYW